MRQEPKHIPSSTDTSESDSPISSDSDHSSKTKSSIGSTPIAPIRNTIIETATGRARTERVTTAFKAGEL